MESAEFIERLRKVVPAEPRVHPLHIPSITEVEKRFVADCLDSTFVSSVGAYVDEMERRLEAMTGARRAIVVVNGTAAIEVSLRVAGVQPGDLVVCPALTFVATANAIRHAGAVPAFVDVETDALGLCPEALDAFLVDCAAQGRRVGAVVLVHIFGNPAYAVEVREVCDRHGVPLVEDAAESLGGFIGDRHTGLFGMAGAISFNGNKIVTTGGGGAVLVDDEERGNYIKHLTTTAKRPHRWEYWHTEWAYNYRMPNLNAALGCAQLERFDALRSEKQVVHDSWLAAFEDSDARVLTARSGTTSNVWLNAVVLPPGTALATRNRLLDAACDEGILCRPIWVPMHKLPEYQDCLRGPLARTEDLWARVINLPSSAYLGREG